MVNSIIDKVRANLKACNLPFKQNLVTPFRLKRSIIPVENCDRLVFYLDHDSNLTLSAKALSLGLTPDELIRQLIWSID